MRICANSTKDPLLELYRRLTHLSSFHPSLAYSVGRQVVKIVNILFSLPCLVNKAALVCAQQPVESFVGRVVGFVRKFHAKCWLIPKMALAVGGEVLEPKTARPFSIFQTGGMTFLSQPTALPTCKFSIKPFSQPDTSVCTLYWRIW